MPDLRNLMIEAGLGKCNTFKKMTISALEKAVAKARRDGETSISRGRWDAPLELMESILARCHGANSQVASISDSASQDGVNTVVKVPAVQISDTAANSLPKLSDLAAKGLKRRAMEEDVQDEVTNNNDQTATVSQEAAPTTPAQPGSTASAAYTSSVEMPASQPRKRARLTPTKEGPAKAASEYMKTLSSQVLDHYQKERLQMLDFDETEQVEFDKIRHRFTQDASARIRLGMRDCNVNPLKSGVRAKDRVDTTETTTSVEAAETNEMPMATGASPPSGTIATNDPAHAETAAGQAVIPTATPQTRDHDDGDQGQGETDITKLLEMYKMPTEIYEPKPLSEKKVAELKATSRQPPRYLYRASSWEGQKHTNGHDELTMHLPAAHKNEDERCHDSLYDIPNGLGELREMLGHRFLWVDRRRDETLSWTSSLLFSLVHATSRLAKGQRHIVIHVIDTTKVKTIQKQPVEFFFAPDLMRVLDIQGWDGWDDRFDRTNLRQPWYTHEWITQGAVMSPAAHSFEAKIDELMDFGLFGFLPSLRTKDGDHMRSLYHRCVYSRSVTHAVGGLQTAMTLEELVIAKMLAKCFLHREERDNEPPIAIFLDFLGLCARPRNDEAFMQWIREHFTGRDILDADFAAHTRVANNLPEMAQTLNLARDACAALDLPTIPFTKVWMADADFDFYCQWTKNETKKIQPRDRQIDKKKRKKVTDAANLVKVVEDGPSGKGDEAALKVGNTALQGFGASSTVIDMSDGVGSLAMDDESDEVKGGSVSVAAHPPPDLNVAVGSDDEEE